MKAKNIRKIIEILFLVILVLVINACEKKVDLGHFEVKDGEETFMQNGQVIGNKLVEVDGKLYYVDESGHKVKEEWAIIDNDGHYGYFGNFGDLVINKIRTIDGKDYYFDENGALYQDRTEKQVKKIEGVEYIANRNGELRFANDETTVKETITATTTKPVTTNTQQTISAAEYQAQQAAVQAAAQAAAQTATTQATQSAQATTNAPFANAIDITHNTTTVPDEFGGPGVVSNAAGRDPNKVQTTQAATSNSNNTTQTSTEVKILKTEKIVDTIDGDDYECTVTLLKPIMNGSTEEETYALNACIDELMDAWWDEVSGLVGEAKSFPKSVTFTSAALGTVTKSKIQITITGNMKPKSGSSKTVKYRITYNREEENGDIQKVSS